MITITAKYEFKPGGCGKAVKNKAESSGGFSLIEVLVSLVILAVGILAIAQLQVGAINALTFSRHLTTATHLAEKNLEWLKSFPYDANATSILIYKVESGSTVPVKPANNLSLFYDNSLVDGAYGSTWLIHPENPMDAAGRKITSGSPMQMRYFVRWRVNRGCTLISSLNGSCTVSYPPPGQMEIELQVIWWEGRNPPANYESTLGSASLGPSYIHHVTMRATHEPGKYSF